MFGGSTDIGIDLGTANILVYVSLPLLQWKKPVIGYWQ